VAARTKQDYESLGKEAKGRSGAEGRTQANAAKREVQAQENVAKRAAFDAQIQFEKAKALEKFNEIQQAYNKSETDRVSIRKQLKTTLKSLYAGIQDLWDWVLDKPPTKPNPNPPTAQSSFLKALKTLKSQTIYLESDVQRAAYLKALADARADQAKANLAKDIENRAKSERNATKEKLRVNQALADSIVDENKKLASQNAQARLEQQRSREELRLKKLENQEKEAKLEHKIQDNKKHLSSMVQVQQQDQANALAAAKKLSVLEAQSAAAKDTRKAADQTAIDAARRFQDAKANELQAEAIELQKKRLAQKKKLEAKVAVLQLAAKKKSAE
jgi:hypothetical protein